MSAFPAVVVSLAAALGAEGWVTDLLVAGSLASGDHVPGVSDIDLVALTDGPVDRTRRARIVDLHRSLDEGDGRGAACGCVYVDRSTLLDEAAVHPVWTHGRLLTRPLSPITRAELAVHGRAVFGQPPSALLPPPDPAALRRAARDEVLGWWATASRRPWMWLDRGFADLSLTAMARGRRTLATGTLLTKSAAASHVRAPQALIEQVRARRRGEPVVSPRFATAWIAWRDARRTVAELRRSARTEQDRPR